MMKLQKDEKVEFEEKKNSQTKDCYDRSKNNCSKRSEPIVIMLGKFEDCPLVVWSTITNQFQNFFLGLPICLLLLSKCEKKRVTCPR